MLATPHRQADAQIRRDSGSGDLVDTRRGALRIPVLAALAALGAAWVVLLAALVSWVGGSLGVTARDGIVVGVTLVFVFAITVAYEEFVQDQRVRRRIVEESLVRDGHIDPDGLHLVKVTYLDTKRRSSTPGPDESGAHGGAYDQ